MDPYADGDWGEHQASLRFIISDAHTNREYTIWTGFISYHARLYSPSRTHIAGPMAGAPFAPPAPVPPAVIPAFFHKVCETKTVINPSEVNGQIPDASAATLVQAWVDKLNQVDDRCVEIEAKTQQIFDFWSVTYIDIPLRAPKSLRKMTRVQALWRFETAA